MIENEMPFKFGQLVGVTEFTNRELERARLKQNFKASLNTILISPRRWGKSSLVNAVCSELKAESPELITVSIDLFNVSSEDDFYKKLAEAVITASVSKLEERTQLVLQFFKRIIPTISFSPLPNQSFDLNMNWEEVKKNPDEILNLAEEIALEKGTRFVVCVDEFQNIAHFENPLQFQKKLRAHWQKHQNVAYCLFGSKRNMMMEVFTSPKMPFYKFGDLILLEKIKEANWVEFICSRFADTGKSISPEVAARIAQLAENHPYYVQQLAQLTWLRTDTEASIEIADAALQGLINQLDLLFQNITDALTITQIKFLNAMLDGVEQFNSQENINKYGYGTSANVKRIKEALQTKEIIDIPKAGAMNLLDPIYKHWLQTVYFSKR